MVVIFIDDDQMVLNSIFTQARQINYINPVCFCDPNDALKFAQNNKIDIAFVDMELGKESGIEVAQKLREAIPNISLLFLTAHDNYALRAFQIKAQGYLIKPVTKEDLEKEIQYIMKGILPKHPKILDVVTFGNFDVFINGKQIKFKRAKSKELFAYLVDRKGSSISTQEAIAVLWEDVSLDKKIRSMLHNLIADMNKTLEEHGCKNVIIKYWNSIAIDTGKISCDYYNFLNGDKNAIEHFCGEYMSNYSWGEFTLSSLEEKEMRFLNKR